MAAKGQETEVESGGFIEPSPGIEIRKPKVRKSEALWLMTFSDLSFVLMCFFILLLTFSEPKKDKYDNVSTGMAAKQVEGKEGPNLAKLENKIKKVIKKKKLKNVASVKMSSRGLLIEFKDAALFASGSASPNLKYKKVVGDVLQAISKAPKRYKLVIEGHTDDVPTRGRRFRSNWDLASARGVAMLDIFKNRGVDEQRMSVEAFAHTRPKVAIKGLKGVALRDARAQNRRVVIRLE